MSEQPTPPKLNVKKFGFDLSEALGKIPSNEEGQQPTERFQVELFPVRLVPTKNDAEEFVVKMPGDCRFVTVHPTIEMVGGGLVTEKGGQVQRVVPVVVFERDTRTIEQCVTELSLTLVPVLSPSSRLASNRELTLLGTFVHPLAGVLVALYRVHA